MTYDGTHKQPGTHDHDHGLTGDSPHFSLIGLREMVVVKSVYTDDANNRSRAFVEYEVRDLYSGEIYTNVRRCQIMGGMVDGDDDVLHPAAQLRDGASSSKISRFTRANDTDGDRVLVAFVEGSKQRPVIIGVLTHTYANYGATTADGERRFTTHKGTTIEIKSNGEYVITHKSGSTIHLDDSGNVIVVPSGTAHVLLGDEASTTPALNTVDGTDFLAALGFAIAQAASLAPPPVAAAAIATLTTLQSALQTLPILNPTSPPQVAPAHVGHQWPVGADKVNAT